jgi:hypothetical protein
MVSPRDREDDRRLHEMCEAWALWTRTRRFYGPPPLAAGLLARLAGGARRMARPGGPDAPCSAEIAAFHLAVISQPPEALDRRVFELHYAWRVRNVKAAAAALGISRQHWYALLRAFRGRAWRASREILADQRGTPVEGERAGAPGRRPEEVS